MCKFDCVVRLISGLKHVVSLSFVTATTSGVISGVLCLRFAVVAATIATLFLKTVKNTLSEGRTS